MKNQSTSLILASTILTWGSVAYGAEESAKRVSASLMGSPPVSREIPHDVVLVPLGPLARAKAASLETYYEKQQAALEDEEVLAVLERSLVEPSEPEDEVAQFQRAIRLSLGVESELAAPSASLSPSRSPSRSPSSLPIGEKKASSPGKAAALPIAAPLVEEDPIPENVRLLSLETEREAQRQRELDSIRERLNLNRALSRSLWDEEHELHTDLLGLIWGSSSSSSTASTAPSRAIDEGTDNSLGVSALQPIPTSSIEIPPYIPPPAVVSPPGQTSPFPTSPTEAASHQAQRAKDNNFI